MYADYTTSPVRAGIYYIGKLKYDLHSLQFSFKYCPRMGMETPPFYVCESSDDSRTKYDITQNKTPLFVCCIRVK